MLDKEAILNKLNKMCENTMMETLKIQYTKVGNNYLQAVMPVNSRVHQPYGLLHGGASAALAESVGSAASAIFVDTNTYIVKGIELSISHLKSIREGKITATAKVVHKGKTTHLWEIKIVNENGDLISVSKLTNIVLEKK